MKILLSVVTIIFLILSYSHSSLGNDRLSGLGIYLEHIYNYQEGENKVIAVTFEPFLPRDDTIVIGAMLEVINTVFGKHRITNLKPSLVNKNGRRIVQFDGLQYFYNFLLFKEDTGEVNGFGMWREGKA